MLFAVIAFLVLHGQTVILHAQFNNNGVVTFQEAVQELDYTENTQHHNSDNWNYDVDSLEGPPHWKENYPMCKPTSPQSPINIKTKTTKYMKFSPRWITRPDFELKGKITETHKAPTFIVKYRCSKATDCNSNCNDNAIDYNNDNGNGNGNKELSSSDCSNTYHLTGVPLEKRRHFILKQFHFHFTSKDGTGSEHAVNGRKFDAEIHFVHFNSKYDSYEEAAAKRDGLVVVAMFLKVGRDADSTMSKILKNFKSLSRGKYDYWGLLDSFNLMTGDFYYYRGSTTSPGCCHGVRWLVRKNVVHVTESQLNILRRVRYKTHGKRELISKIGNIRPLQEFWKPKVFRNFQR